MRKNINVELNHDTLSFEGMSQADGGTIADITHQIQTIQATITSLTNQYNQVKSDLAYFQANVGVFAFGIPGNISTFQPTPLMIQVAQRLGTVDMQYMSAGSNVTKDYAAKVQQMVVSKIGDLKLKADSLPNQIKDAQNSLAKLTASMDSIAKNDPNVIKAIADANQTVQRALSKSSTTKIIMYSLAGLAVIAGLVWGIDKVIKTKAATT